MNEIQKIEKFNVEVYKYPYCGRLDDTEDYLSDKICCYTIRIRKKIIKKAKWLIVSSEMDQLYPLSIEFKNNSINQEELIGKISNLRGGAFIDIE